MDWLTDIAIFDKYDPRLYTYICKKKKAISVLANMAVSCQLLTFWRYTCRMFIYFCNCLPFFFFLFKKKCYNLLLRGIYLLPWFCYYLCAKICYILIIRCIYLFSSFCYYIYVKLNFDNQMYRFIAWILLLFICKAMFTDHLFL